MRRAPETFLEGSRRAAVRTVTVVTTRAQRGPGRATDREGRRGNGRRRTRVCGLGSPGSGITAAAHDPPGGGEGLPSPQLGKVKTRSAARPGPQTPPPSRLPPPIPAALKRSKY